MLVHSIPSVSRQTWDPVITFCPSGNTLQQQKGTGKTFTRGLGKPRIGHTEISICHSVEFNFLKLQLEYKLELYSYRHISLLFTLAAKEATELNDAVEALLRSLDRPPKLNIWSSCIYILYILCIKHLLSCAARCQPARAYQHHRAQLRTQTQGVQ